MQRPVRLSTEEDEEFVGYLNTILQGNDQAARKLRSASIRLSCLKTTNNILLSALRVNQGLVSQQKSNHTLESYRLPNETKRTPGRAPAK